MKKIITQTLLCIAITCQVVCARTSTQDLMNELPAYLLGFDTISQLQKGNLVPALAIKIHSALPQAREKVITLQKLLAHQKPNPAISALKEALQESEATIHIVYQKEFLMSYQADDAARLVTTLKASCALANQKIETYLAENPNQISNLERLMEDIKTIAFS